MNRTLLAMAGLLLSGTALPAQIVSLPGLSPAVTTGAVGLAGSQTAQLNVVNLNTPSTTTATTPTVTCQVQLEFWDSQGKMVKSRTFSNLAPVATASLHLKLTEVTTNTSPLRSEVRGVVRRTTSTSGVTTTPTPTPQPIFFVPASCSVATTLEVFDSTTGVTQTLTSDLHTLEDLTVVVPAVANGR